MEVLPRKVLLIGMEELLISISFVKPEYAKDIFSRLHENDIEKNILKNIFLKVKNREGFPSLENMNSLFEDDEISYITSLTIGPDFDQDVLHGVIDDCFRKLRKRTLQTTIDEIELEIKIAESSGDVSALNSLLSRKQSLIQEAKCERLL